MPRVIVFDVNETLLDTRALDPLFTRIFGAARARASPGSVRRFNPLL
jgi:2-haloacid dehalogenase